MTVELGHSVYRIVRGYGGLVRAESQCVVAKVAVAVGDEVEPGDLLLIAEAMKMESPIFAPFAGRVSEIVAGAGTLVGAGDPIIRIEALETDSAGDTADAAPQLSFTELATGGGTDGNRDGSDHDALIRLVLGQDLRDEQIGGAIARVGGLSFDDGLDVLRTAAHRLALFTGPAAATAERPDLLILALRSPIASTRWHPHGSSRACDGCCATTA